MLWEARGTRSCISVHGSSALDCLLIYNNLQLFIDIDFKQGSVLLLSSALILLIVELVYTIMLQTMASCQNSMMLFKMLPFKGICSARNIWIKCDNKMFYIYSLWELGTSTVSNNIWVGIKGLIISRCIWHKITFLEEGNYSMPILVEMG